MQRLFMSNRSNLQKDKPKPKSRWCSFSVARSWARQHQLLTGDQWRELCVQGKLPSDIPRTPEYVYKSRWKSWGDFLGTGAVASQNRKYRSFEDARKWAHTKRLKTYKEWETLGKEERLPKDIPTNVKQVYKAKWIGVGDFLGTGTVATYNRKYRTFTAARKWARGQGLQSETQWREYCKLRGWLPVDIPASVATYYKEEWTTWGDFLGTGYVSTQKRNYRPFDQARDWACSQGLKSMTEWWNRVNEPGWRPDDIPADPRNGYKSEWTSWGDFLGTGNLAPSEYQFRDFLDAKAWAIEQKLDDVDSWKALVKSLKALKQWPADIPTNPSRLYKPEWNGWEDFLGLSRMHRRSKVEERLKHELEIYLPIELNFRSIPIAGSRALEADICAPSIRLAIEFDGNHWHKNNQAPDRKKTKALEKAGWAVVRIREHPLKALGPNDLVVPVKLSPFNLALIVLKHLSTLGHVSPEDVSRYEAGGRAVNGSVASNAI